MAYLSETHFETSEMCGAPFHWMGLDSTMKTNIARTNDCGQSTRSNRIEQGKFSERSTSKDVTGHGNMNAQRATSTPVVPHLSEGSKALRRLILPFEAAILTR
ncbi:hypothetical protein KIN20_037269 [Parelaphostrongylus tenuis]|uniref:Uncharacterized protein n=1 Tax=Parelaphostrongylus tenuis TaxID=148309 RepID=A0AAD5REG3_PARTN|nr:hypothetical protein KIN20_037269 [Parelaphostrongylus tenuis]